MTVPFKVLKTFSYAPIERKDTTAIYLQKLFGQNVAPGQDRIISGNTTTNNFFNLCRHKEPITRQHATTTILLY